MKKLIFSILFIVASATVNAQTNPKTVRVNSYTTKQGTVVKSHVRTAPNNTKTDNFSFPGNFNPNK